MQLTYFSIIYVACVRFISDVFYINAYLFCMNNDADFSVRNSTIFIIHGSFILSRPTCETKGAKPLQNRGEGDHAYFLLTLFFSTIIYILDFHKLQKKKILSIFLVKYIQKISNFEVNNFFDVVGKHNLYSTFFS